VDPVPDPLHLRKSGSAENQTLTSGSVGRNSDHKTTEAVYILLKLNSMVSVRERTIPTERPPLVGEVLPTWADRRCHVVSVTAVFLGFLDRSRYFSIK
jgi:hypothetical protein